ncbi:uncharacterized protein F4807DRAFT_434772 [Annulohypoxylon truncatum]|uniref:uncharacterized protein n=1 Tax=Annulohypoxylon truncatum TaxID=327061 RepID=UPI00200725BA|nr:uncharacterized protein F4807DRAFT_434772 [Annulohypoxylon truncatum]KAI1207496.1 hypothetical protein F4807DRAFT_434772 [Annulohypoxylon truncatum]
MSSTSLPFLYYTRTILRTSPRKAPTTLARSLHATVRQQVRGNDDIPFDLNVGEEDILRRRPESQQQQQAEAGRRGTITPSERLIFERIFADIRARGLKPTFRPDSPSDAATRSTMLIMQQAAQDAGQSRPATVAAPGLLAGAARDRHKALLRFPPELREAAGKALGTIQSSSAVTHFGGGRGDEEQQQEGGEDAAKADKKKEADVDEGWKTPAHSINRTIELEAKRRPERVRVEGLIVNAKTDFELWDVLEKEVFTMPARLGINRGAPTTEPEEEISDELEAEEEGIVDEELANSSEEASDALDTAEVAGNEPENEAEGTDDVAADVDVAPDSDTPPEELSLYVYGPLYPAYLLLALRRLDTAFRAPSLLAFSLLPRIKELGLESYILGVSTPFYNELLEIYWNRRGDLPGMLHLLEEMRHCGLYFDEQTASILNQVDTATAALATKVSSGSFGRALMTMPEYDRDIRDRLRHWHRIVDLSIKEREQDIGY